ncbi:MAG: TetR family transcriptional regulator C-terminal domain-containing protein [Solirubrobacteraceae bacterium]|nr:TetR family transcriptional regulator C-terminal domain-containing protein [Solirubrobacteraceae bacterium]
MAVQRKSSSGVQAQSGRRTVLTDAALRVLGAEGARGLTHRRVDQETGLPAGSTSNLFGTREQLLLGALDRLVEVEFGGALVPPIALQDPLEHGSQLLAGLIREWTAPEHRALLQARFELLIEATRKPAFRPPLLERRSEIIGAVEQLMRADGRPDPARRAVSLVAWVDGLLLHHLLDPDLIANEAELAALVRMQLGGPTAQAQA